jgi:hypothetical protein
MEISEANRAVELIAHIRDDVEAIMARRGLVLAQALTGPHRYRITRKNGNVLFEASTFRDLRAWLLRQPSSRTIRPAPNSAPPQHTETPAVRRLIR